MRPKFTVNYDPGSEHFSYGLKPQKGVIPCILKIPTERNEDYQQIEYVYSLMAKNSSIRIPETFLKEEKDRYYFAIRRFDINKDLSRNHVHTLAGMMGIDFSNRIIDYRDALKLTFNLTRDKREVEEFFRRMVFNIIGYNCDDHTKNFSFIMDHSGKWSLSPAYDMTYSRSRNNMHQMSINGKLLNFAQDQILKK